MKRLSLATETVTVRRTGLPFYDAARVIGVAQLFFGTAEATVTDRGFGWAIRGVGDLSQPNKQRLWIGERLAKGFDSKALNYQRFHGLLEMAGGSESTQSVIEHDWTVIRDYFLRPLNAEAGKSDSVLMEMEAALGQGVRGPDPRAYGNFASEMGTKSQEPWSETIAAVIGLSYAAKVVSGKATMYLLPIFGETTEKAGNSYPISTATYWNYSRQFSHDASEQVALLLAALTTLETLVEAQLPVKDFAFNFVRAKGPYYSGTMGAERLCRNWSTWRSLLGEVQQFLASTTDKKWNKGTALDLARALSELAHHLDAQSLERVVRLKVRLMAADDLRAFTLLSRPETQEEIEKSMAIPEVPAQLCVMVAKALALPKEGSPDKKADTSEWIGRYLKLENAGDAYRFYTEIERLLSRSLLAKGDEMLKYLAWRMESGGGSMTQEMDRLKSQQTFRAWRSAFLLKVLQNVARTSPPVHNGPATEETEAPSETTDKPEGDGQE